MAEYEKLHLVYPSENPPALNLPQEGDSAGCIQWFNLMKNPTEDFQQAWAKAVAQIRERNRKSLVTPIQGEGPLL